MASEDASAPGSQSLGNISEADLDEKIARDMVTVRNVIDGLRTLEQQADETAIALGRIAAKVYTQAENDRIRALLQSYLNTAPFFSGSLGITARMRQSPAKISA
jgi:hypothetical protein